MTHSRASYFFFSSAWKAILWTYSLLGGNLRSTLQNDPLSATAFYTCIASISRALSEGHSGIDALNRNP